MPDEARVDASPCAAGGEGVAQTVDVAQYKSGFAASCLVESPIADL
jgi:hypothetical protein